jgi:hypothetical protein
MRLPRDLSGMNLAKALGRVGYRVVRQTPLKVGTLTAILSDDTDHLQLDRDELIERLFG